MQDEALRYHRVPKAARVQAELTHAAASLGDLLPASPGSIVLDLGAGGGLSTLSFQALAASRPGTPPYILSFDTSLHMLATTTQIHESALVGIRVPSMSADRGVEAGHVDISEGLQWISRRGDRILADMSQPLPLREGVADAVLSISAVQWLLEPRPDRSEAESHSAETPSVPQRKLTKLFTSLRTVTADTAKLAMQFYPPKGDHDFGARALRDSARQAQWTDVAVLLDFPHHPSSLAKKWFLTARCRDGDRQTNPLQPRWCALCWPVVVAGCVLQSSCRQRPSGKVLCDRAEQQHAELALRLVRCGRRLQASEGAEGDDAARKIQERLQQQLHPLQLELARGLFQALEACRQLEATETVAGVEAEAEEEEGRNCAQHEAKRAKAGPQTRTELRSAVVRCLPQLLPVLHSAPSQCWQQPPPPLAQAQSSQVEDLAHGL